MHIEARMEEIKKLKGLVKILKDFQVSCRKRTGRALSQKKDARVQLISGPKIRANAKLNEKKTSAMYYGPLENCQVANYREALEQFPVFLGREKWTNEEKENLAKGVKQQFQEMLLQRSLDLVSGPDGSLGDSNDLDSILASIGDHDITPERLRLFIPMVNWDQLASMYVPGRSGAECQSRWLNCDDPLLNQNPWSKVEDKNLLHIVQQKGVSNWVDISVSLATNRTPFQCLARYQRSLNASILKREWTEEEDNLLRAAVEAFGESNWQAVASAMEGRTGTQCSNRWKKTINPARKKVGRWTPDEDKRLKVAVMLFGPKTWNKIAQFVPGRTQVQCRERWVNTLDPSLNWNSWSEEEDLKLKAAISEHGYCWSKVAACVPRRTDNQCWRRWKVLAPEEVPLLQAARKLQKDALISNFVDRESERPTLGPSDFVPLPAITDASEHKNANPSVKQKKRSRRREKTAVADTGRPDTLEAMANGEDLETSDSAVLHGGGVDLTLRKRRSKRKPKSGDKTSAYDVLSKKPGELTSHLIEHHSSCLMDPSSSVITNGEDVGELGRDNGGSCHRKSSKLHPRQRSEVMEENGGSDASYGEDVSELYKDDQDATQASESQKDVTDTYFSKQVKTSVVKKSNAKSTSKKSLGPDDVRDVQLSLITGKEARKRKKETAVGEDVCKVTSPSNEGLKSHIENAGSEEPVQISSLPLRCSTLDILESGKSEALAIQGHDKLESSKGKPFLNKIIEEREEDAGMTLASFLKKLQGAKKTLASPVNVDRLYKKGVRNAKASQDNLSSTNLGYSNGRQSSRVSGETQSIQKYAGEDGDNMILSMFCKSKRRKTESSSAVSGSQGPEARARRETS